jgi:putative transcriptional regulator
MPLKRVVIGWGKIMMRVRLKADGRVVEILADGTERTMSAPTDAPLRAAQSFTDPGVAAYAKGVRAATRLTQSEFAARIGVPLETVRNWEQGKRVPRGPARALLKVIERAPELAFAALSRAPA